MQPAPKCTTAWLEPGWETYRGRAATYLLVGKERVDDIAETSRLRVASLQVDKSTMTRPLATSARGIRLVHSKARSTGPSPSYLRLVYVRKS